MTGGLALLGGTPLWTSGWPAWPMVGPETLRKLEAVLAGGRWAISGQSNGQETWDQIFSRRFAGYVGVDHCFTVDHGSSALIAAFLALDVGAGDEVIVPGLTWVACASAVMRVGAVPVLVDVCPDTLCMDPAAIEAAMSPRTRCILVVHLYSCMADMDRIRAIAERHGLAVVEDCAQAHGAEWRGRRAGSLGDVAGFSMQQGKVLTCGEGGAVLTRDDRLADRVERLRCDGRRYTPQLRRTGLPNLEEVRGLQGMNLCLSEFQAALLCDGLDRLALQTRTRAERATRLDRALGERGWLQPVKPHPANTGRAYYHYVVRVAPEVAGRVPVGRICEALSAELGAWVHGPYAPLHRHPLFAPNTLAALPRMAVPGPQGLANAEDQSARAVLLHHALLLADDAAIDVVPEAFDKVFAHLEVLAAQ